MKNVLRPNRYKTLISFGVTALLLTGTPGVCNAEEEIPELMIWDEQTQEEELFSMTETDPKVKMLREGQFPDLIVYADPYEYMLEDEDSSNDWKELATQRYVNGLNNLAAEIDISDLNISPERSGELFTLIRDILNRSPQLFYARADVRIWHTSTRIVKIDQLYSAPYIKDDNSIDIPKLSTDKNRFMGRYQEAIASVNDQMSPIEKILAVHDWVVRECDYDIVNYQNNTIPEVSYTARGVFLEGKAVCAGYTEAMAILLNNLGFETVTVSSDAMNHAWNIVKVGNDYFHLDATWDDPAWTGYDQYKDQINEGYISHEYFMKSDSEMINELRHYGWNIEQSPRCNVSGSYANYPFRTYQNTSYTYYGGLWYYAVGDSIYATNFADMQTQSRRVTESDGAVTLLNAFVQNGSMYYSTTRNVYKLDSLQAGGLNLDQAYSFYRVGQQHPGYLIGEFALKQGEVHVNGYNGNGGFFEDRPVPQQVVLNGWISIDGKDYWYENGVRQGYRPNDPHYRGKEIYDPGTNEWYWLDNVQQGAKAVSKDVYQESQANGSGKIGKWVRYDANGHMIKGWNFQNGNTYYFDPIYGTMLKGVQFIDGGVYYFDEITGIMTVQTSIPQNGWYILNGETYWYKNGVRQGYDPSNRSYRGKEIYDANTDAWYWLDNSRQGARARSKDVYQESAAGQWAAKPNGTGKWVRYDENGHMIKGWNVQNGNTYYFDWVYGTMARGNVVIDGQSYYFDPITGILVP